VGSETFQQSRDLAAGGSGSAGLGLTQDL